MNNSDIQYSDSDEQSFRNPNVMMMPAYEDGQNNRTADTAKLNLNNDQEDRSYVQASQLFQKFYLHQLVKNERNMSQLHEHKIFQKFRKYMRVYEPKPNLYFLPTYIILDCKVQKVIIGLRNQIVDQFPETANVQIPKQRTDQLTVSMHNEVQMSNYIIRFNQLVLNSKYDLRNPELLDSDLSLNPLFQFYQKNYDYLKFSQTCGILLYWAYQKGLLSTDYLSESALKIIVIFFYFSMGQGVTNIINEFYADKKNQLEKCKRMYKVNKKLQCQLQPQLFEFSNFTLVQKRSFYQQSQRRYSTMTQILPVPYPVCSEDLKQYGQRVKKSKYSIRSPQGQNRHQSDSANKPVHSIIKFFKIMQYLQNCMKRCERIIFDFAKNRKGVTTRNQLDFNIQIIHPVFGHNICEKLTNDPSKLRILKQEITNVMSVYKRLSGNALQTLITIFEKI